MSEMSHGITPIKKSSPANLPKWYERDSFASEAPAGWVMITMKTEAPMATIPATTSMIVPAIPPELVSVERHWSPSAERREAARPGEARVGAPPRTGGIERGPFAAAFGTNMAPGADHAGAVKIRQLSSRGGPSVCVPSRE